MTVAGHCCRKVLHRPTHPSAEPLELNRFLRRHRGRIGRLIQSLIGITGIKKIRWRGGIHRVARLDRHSAESSEREGLKGFGRKTSLTEPSYEIVQHMGVRGVDAEFQ